MANHESSLDRCDRHGWKPCLTAKSGKPGVREVVSLLRRPSGIQHPKLTELVIDNFLSLAEDPTYFQDIDAVYYCRGVYTRTIDRETFRKITIDYPETLAKIIKKQSPTAKFCLLSGAGADRTGKSRMAFAEDKGEI